MNVGSPSSTLAPSGVMAIAEHQLLQPIASGSYGEVWLARSAVGTLRAVKIVRRDRFEREEDFEREFRGLQRFEPVSRTHEALVDILQIGRQDDWFYYVMELADDVGNWKTGSQGPKETRSPKPEVTARDGARTSEPGVLSEVGGRPSDSYSPRTLRADLKSRSALPVDATIALGLKLADALGHLHGNGLVHRDVKPSNILFIQGEAKLADAGLVAAVDDARSLVGTPGYIPPEGPGAPKADIYSLGKVLYEAAFGKDRQDFPQLPTDVAERPGHAQLLELNEIIVKACARDPRERYATAAELFAELAGLQGGKSIRKKRQHERQWAICRKASLVTGVIGLLGLATLSAVRGLSEADFQSPNREVNTLVAKGNYELSNPLRANTALTYFRDAIDLEPEFVPALFGLFRVYEQQDDRSNQYVLAIKLMQLRPSLAETHIAATYTNWYAWKFREALAEARLATQSHAASKVGRGVAHSTLGFCLLFTGDPSAAAKEFQLAERDLPTDPAIQHALGHSYFLQHRFKEAIERYRNSIKLEAQYGLGYELIANTYVEMEEFDNAVDFYLQAAALGEGDITQAKRRYEALRLAARQGGAPGFHRKELEFALNAPHPDSYSLADCYARIGNKEKAYEWLAKAIAEHNDGLSHDLMFNLCWDHNDEQFKALARKAGLLW